MITMTSSHDFHRNSDVYVIHEPINTCNVIPINLIIILDVFKNSTKPLLYSYINSFFVFFKSNCVISKNLDNNNTWLFRVQQLSAV